MIILIAHFALAWKQAYTYWFMQPPTNIQVVPVDKFMNQCICFDNTILDKLQMRITECNYSLCYEVLWKIQNSQIHEAYSKHYTI